MIESRVFEKPMFQILMVFAMDGYNFGYKNEAMQ